MPNIIGKYELIKTLGRGGFSKVKLARNRDNFQEVAIKIHKLDNPELDQERVNVIQNEAKLLSTIQHERIVNIIDYFPRQVVQKTDGTQYEVVCVIISEIADGGELFFYVKNSGAFKERHARHLFRQMLEGLHFLHKQGFCHRDLKPDNILLTENFDVKIADFGFAGPMAGRQNEGYLTTTLGTVPYQAPEINLRQTYKGEDVDVFSLGIILFIMVTGLPPFKVADDSDFFYRQIIHGKMAEYWDYFKSQVKLNGGSEFSENFMDLIQRMLEFIPDQRIKLDQIFEHNWVKSSDYPYPDEIRQELARRKAKNSLEEQKVAAQKKQQKAKYHAKMRGVINEDDVDDDDTKKEAFKIEKHIDVSNEQMLLNHVILISEHPDEILEVIQDYINEKKDEEDIEINENAKKPYKALIKHIKPEGISLEFSFNIIKLEGQEMFAIEFQNYNGLQDDFLNFINDLDAELSKKFGYVDVEDEEAD
ncbi:protein kinase domain containing protein [Stylonychia lemnae]|uniref:Protein kinase domain containing protein n=1 Tax=Stylonychia lemnae TaxID=5949 RepID=A0A078B521_STYLE|nr:protein kinase domain containing protein [Stylonychia lemnae]|eukprot:CDW89341.1 protein kinase domain containing protein [Stylonychia lemnae]